MKHYSKFERLVESVLKLNVHKGASHIQISIFMKRVKTGNWSFPDIEQLPGSQKLAGNLGVKV